VQKGIFVGAGAPYRGRFKIRPGFKAIIHFVKTGNNSGNSVQHPEKMMKNIYKKSSNPDSTELIGLSCFSFGHGSPNFHWTKLSFELSKLI